MHTAARVAKAAKPRAAPTIVRFMIGFLSMTCLVVVGDVPLFGRGPGGAGQDRSAQGTTTVVTRRGSSRRMLLGCDGRWANDGWPGGEG